MVRQGTLTPSLAGSSPAIPAKVYPEGRTGMIGCLPSCENKPSAPLAQSVEHLPFKQGVRGSNPRRGTKKRSTAKRCFSFWCLPVFAVQKPGPQAAFDQNREGETAQGFPLTRPFPCLIGKRFPLTPQSWAFRMVLLFLASGGFETSVRLRAAQWDVEAGRNIPPAHRGSIPQFFCWKNRRTCGIIS